MAEISHPPPLTRMLETILYVKSMEESVAFYRDVFNLQPILSTERISVLPMDKQCSHVLLLFQLGATAEDVPDKSVPGNVVPGHGPTEPLLKLLMDRAEGEVGKDGVKTGEESLKQHFCFAASTPDDVKAWENYLRAKDVKITGKMDWGKRGYSVYFADPDGNVGEVASERLWELL